MLSMTTLGYALAAAFLLPAAVVAAKLILNRPGVMVNLVDTTAKYYDASRRYRLDAIDGKLHSGTPVADPRSEDRTCY